MKKCKFCFATDPESESACGICKIDFSKQKQELSPEEKKRAYYCRAMRIVGFLSMIGGIFLFIGSLLLLFSPAKQSKVASPIIAPLTLVLSILYLIFGYSLRRFKKWCFYGSIGIYGSSILMNLLSFNIMAVLINILFLSYIVNSTSKKILYRNL
jgi:hypothetical protein